MPGESGVHEPRGGVRQQAQASEGALALETSGDAIRERHELEGAAEDELAGVQGERLVRVDLDEVGKVGLVFGGIDERVLVVVEQAEEPIEAHIDARRLHHLEVERFEADAAGGEL